MTPAKAIYEVLSLNQVYTLLLKQAVCIRESGFKPDVIVGVCRGGWLPALFLSDLLENPNVASIQVKSYVGIGESHQPTLLQDVSAAVAGKHVLIADDVADSGRSLRLVKEHLLKRGALVVKTATLYFKPQSVFKPDFYAKQTSCWVVFPWNVKETVRALFEANKHDFARLLQETAALEAAGVPKRLIVRFLKEFSEAQTC
ncbi:MAG: phosphoribosyltransferase [Candidatus Bathyarchaeota archaeon]|nr:phosphoribosyltransferase [Candidatus Bathyarchaeota archaeon]